MKSTGPGIDSCFTGVRSSTAPHKRGGFLGREVQVQTRSKLALIGLGASMVLFAFAGAAIADPSDMFVPQVPPHRHFIEQPDGDLVPVGPQICEHPELRKAFEQFHFNIHHSFIPGVGTIHTLGPQNGAPGLHNGTGAEIAATLC